MATQYFKRNFLLNLYREEKNMASGQTNMSSNPDSYTKQVDQLKEHFFFINKDELIYFCV